MGCRILRFVCWVGMVYGLVVVYGNMETEDILYEDGATKFVKSSNVNEGMRDDDWLAGNNAGDPDYDEDIDYFSHNDVDEEGNIRVWGFSGFDIINDEDKMSLGGKSVWKCTGSFFSDGDEILVKMLKSIIGNRGGQPDRVSYCDVRDSLSAGYYTIPELIFRYREYLDEEDRNFVNKNYERELEKEKEKKRKEACILC